jgi:molybdopterin synthase sulfur carrier subunit
MTVKVHLPAILCTLYDTDRIEEVEASSVLEVAHALNERFPGMGERLLEPDGSLRRYVNVFIEMDGERRQATVENSVEGDGKVWVVQNVAGG